MSAFDWKRPANGSATARADRTTRQSLKRTAKLVRADAEASVPKHSTGLVDPANKTYAAIRGRDASQNDTTRNQAMRKAAI